MSTRGVYGFRKNGVDKLSYNHYDSYPSGLGNDVIEFCKSMSIKELNALYDRLEMINEDIPPTPEQIDFCKPWTNLNVSNESTSDWYCLLHGAQGNLSAYKDGLRYMLDSDYFIKDSLFCEYGYIVNLDNNTLEFWEGFQKKPQEGNRYGTEVKESIDEKTKYYPCNLSLTFSLENIPDDAVDQMNTVSKDEMEEGM